MNSFENISLFTAKQMSILFQGKSDLIWKYNPLKIVNTDEISLKENLLELFRNGTGYAKIFKGGIQYDITNDDLDILINFLKSGAIDQIYKYQAIDSSDIDEINEVLQELIKIDENPYESIKCYFETFFETHFINEKDSIDHITSNQEKWKQVMDWVVSETTKDSSLMIKWMDYSESIHISPQLPNSSSSRANSDSHSTPLFDLIDVKLIDVDTKLCTKISEYCKINLEYFKDYADMVFSSKLK